MKTDEMVTNIDTVEEFTLHALDRTTDGLRQLSEDSVRCAKAFASGGQGGLSELSALAGNLRDFDVFENDICDLFQIDPESMSDEDGSLQAARERFHEILNSILVRMSSSDTSGLERLLEHELPESLERFQKLMPVVRDYVHDEYLGK